MKVNGRTVGQVIGLDYVKDMTNRHMLANPPAIANDIQVLHDAERAGAEYCTFTNTDTGIIYRASIAKIWDMGKRFNMGWGDQIMLTLQNWTQERDPNYTNTVTPEYSDPTAADDEVKPLNIRSKATVGIRYKPGKQTPKQLALFGGWK